MSAEARVVTAPVGDESMLEWARRVCREHGIDREVIAADYDAERRVLNVRFAPVLPERVEFAVRL